MRSTPSDLTLHPASLLLRPTLRNPMALETATTINQLDPANPSGSDRLKDGDDHIRMIKAALKATFPGITGALSTSVTHTFLNGLILATMPLGAIIMWSGAAGAVPAGWAICDGSTVAHSIAGTGSVTTPDMRDKVPVGVSPSHAVGTSFGQYAKTVTSVSAGVHNHTASVTAAGTHSHGGSDAPVALTIAQIPAHHHRVVASDSGTASPLTASNAVISLSGLGGDSAYGLAGSAVLANVGLSSDTGGSASHSHTINSDGGHVHAVTLDAQGAHTHGVTIDTSQPSFAVYFIMRV